MAAGQLLSCWSCNVRTFGAAWVAADAALSEQQDVIMLQETSHTRDEFIRYQNSFSRRGFAVYQAPACARKDGRPVGGVLALVSKRHRQRFLWKRAGPGGQVLAVEVAGQVLANTYVHPDGHAQGIIDGIDHDFCVDNTTRWVACGDWNEVPGKLTAPPFVEQKGVSSAAGEWTPTRYKDPSGRQPRPIDYAFVFNSEVDSFDFANYQLSDHKVICFSLRAPPGGIATEVRLRPHVQYGRPPGVPQDTWVEVTRRLWEDRQHDQRNCPHEPGSRSAQQWVNTEWKSFTAALAETLDEAAAHLATPSGERRGEEEEEVDVADGAWRAADYTGAPLSSERVPSRRTVERRRPRRQEVPKGDVSTHEVQWSKLQATAAGSFRQRRCANTLGRLRRLLWLESHGQGRSDEARELRIRCDRADATLGLGSAAEEQQLLDRTRQLEAKILLFEHKMRQLQEDDRQERIEQWKTSMKEDRRAHQWLRGVMPTDPAVSDEQGNVSRSKSEALEFLKQRWRRVWDRPKPDPARWQDYLAAHLPSRADDEAVWRPLDEGEVRTAMERLRGSSAGPDGWLGAELCDALCALGAITFLLNQFETLGLVPDEWKAMRQVHIPKDDTDEGPVSTASLRPISVTSSWYRLWASARFRSHDCSEWIDTWWDDAMLGARKAAEAHEGIAWAVGAAAAGKYLTSWDFSLAFDHTDPEIAAKAFDTLGMPSNVNNMLSEMWCHQLRWLQLGQAVHPEPQRVASSLPQGDPFSPLGLSAVLLAPLLRLRHTCPGVDCRLYVDDRTWAADTAADLKAGGDVWCDASDVFGFVENEGKKQWLHKTPHGRKRLEEDGIDGTCIVDSATVLGAKITGGVRRKASRKERRKLEEAKRQLRRAAKLPTAPRDRLRVAAAGPLAKGCWGWVEGPPNQLDTRQADAAVARVARAPKAALVPLRRLLLGHRADLRYRASHDAVVACARVERKDRGRGSITDVPWTQQGTKGLPAAFDRHLSWTGWRRTPEAWTWEHAELPEAVFSLRRGSPHWKEPRWLGHLLREAWRWRLHKDAIDSARHEAVQVRGWGAGGYDPVRIKAVQDLAQTKGNKAMRVLSGAIVSPLCVTRADGLPDGQCPWCRASLGSHDHLAWQCDGLAQERPAGALPADAMQRRFFWTTGRKERSAVDAKIFEWGLRLDDILINWRYSSDGFLEQFGRPQEVA
ncbi:unnamed protein product [Prorocentrum cordatum]|uniref:Reverse transcriptase domain-containing protein n=1 Tax=Prorocentrum cordatum TaxID=2364126 RepID=A0ABN9PDR2_9DINO|nr:unnamed protein product [Polarella glacialis]